MKTSFALLFLSLSLQVFSQAKVSTDGKFSYTRTFRDLGEQIHWKGSLVRTSTTDTLLVIRNSTHDNPAPIAHWSRSKLVFNEGDTIKVYDPILQKVVFAQPGIIWNHAENFFDSKNNILFFIRTSGTNHKRFDLVMLNVIELKENLLRSFDTSGDPLTGIPSIIVMESTKRELLLEIENKDQRWEKILVKY